MDDVEVTVMQELEDSMAEPEVKKEKEDSIEERRMEKAAISAGMNVWRAKVFVKPAEKLAQIVLKETKEAYTSVKIFNHVLCVLCVRCTGCLQWESLPKT
ncbi:hypothetical protein HOY80DRAFT_1044823 [Tuber brumale]|nr:hypothetical protein HOY80DRAFT_1044823 [Tuber brumale]